MKKEYLEKIGEFAVLKFENVINVSSKNVKTKKKNDRFLDFLAIETHEMLDKNYEMNLIFSGDMVIKLIAAN